MAARRVVRAVVVWAVSLLGVVLGASEAAAAADAGGGGSVATVIGGVPARVAGGGGFTAVFTVESTSRYRILVDSLSLRVSAADDPSGPSDGVTVEWQDPATGAWRDSDTYGGTDWGLALSPPPVVQPRGTLTFRARIRLAAALPGGAYAVETDGVADYRLVDAAGGDAGRLDGLTPARAVFRYAAGPSPSASPPASPSAEPSAEPSASGSVTAPVPAPASTGPEATASPADAPSPAGPPTPDDPTSDSPPDEPSDDPDPADSPAPALAGAAVTDPPGLPGYSVVAAGPAPDRQGPGPADGTLALGLLSITAGCVLGAAELVRRHARP
ncbi:hypothetical protein HUT16_30995 [Kitasatospora sp. NA04385]|uniref:hypothetical protein n=1 Tax=Kitasatospora sp. NA04385 TaxID=2742135 RepID=UPI001590412A|nr:hypothetical protein [Kitasatospora sp. NA04385]QKW22927.1 hypothetical protein HUT16_30995 [Kitasatospora sp. NA04385]